MNIVIFFGLILLLFYHNIYYNTIRKLKIFHGGIGMFVDGCLMFEEIREEEVPEEAVKFILAL